MGVQAGFVSSKYLIQDDAWSLMKYLANNTGERLYNVGNRIPVLKAELNKDQIKNNEFTQGFIAQTAQQYQFLTYLKLKLYGSLWKI